MAVVDAGPESLDAAIRGAGPGTTIRLRPGRYGPLRISGVRVDPNRPIVIDGEERATFDGGTTLAQFQPRAAQVARDTKASGRYPGIYPIAHEATISVANCSGLVLQKLKLANCWPTAIHLDQCQDLVFKGLQGTGSTYFVYAVGASTRGLKLLDCDWQQDDSKEHDLWHKIPWVEVHKDEEDLGKYTGARAYDGSFFNGVDIAGDVEVVRCHVSDAFNGVHLFNRPEDPRLARNVHVHDCTFLRIRDNPIEPENVAVNWWIYDNQICDAHKWFSMDLRSASWFYIFRNRGWFTSKPGKPSNDPKKPAHRRGSVFKLGTAAPLLPGLQGPVQVFNNSWYLRAPILCESVLQNLRHHNNAIVFCSRGNYRPPGITEADGVFGTPGDGVDGDPLFTKLWEQYGIRFENDSVLHPDWPAKLISDGYPLASPLAYDPEFEWATRADDLGDARFRLKPDSKCRNRARAVPIERAGMPPFVPAGDFHIGWYQDREVFKELQYRPLS